MDEGSQPLNRCDKRESLHDFQQRYHEAGGAIVERTLQSQRHLATTISLEPRICNGRAGDGTAQLFEPVTLRAQWMSWIRRPVTGGG